MNVYDNTLYVFIKNLEISIFGRRFRREGLFRYNKSDNTKSSI